MFLVLFLIFLLLPVGGVFLGYYNRTVFSLLYLAAGASIGLVYSSNPLVAIASGALYYFFYLTISNTESLDEQQEQNKR